MQMDTVWGLRRAAAAHLLYFGHLLACFQFPSPESWHSVCHIHFASPLRPYQDKKGSTVVLPEIRNPKWQTELSRGKKR